MPAPTATGLLALGSAICDDDFRATGRTLETLGLAGRSVDDVQTMLQEGA